jgi:hypothetical protein
MQSRANLSPAEFPANRKNTGNIRLWVTLARQQLQHRQCFKRKFAFPVQSEQGIIRTEQGIRIPVTIRAQVVFSLLGFKLIDSSNSLVLGHVENVLVR